MFLPSDMIRIRSDSRREVYDTRQLHRLRRRAVAAAANASRVGLVLGALGRQGSPAILRRVRSLLTQRGIAHFCLILTEVTPDTLKRFDAHVDAWVQVACPRIERGLGPPLQQADAVACPATRPTSPGARRRDDGHYPTTTRAPRSRGRTARISSGALYAEPRGEGMGRGLDAPPRRPHFTLFNCASPRCPHSSRRRPRPDP